MKTQNLVINFIFILILMTTIPIYTVKAFEYKLTESDLPSGYVLKSTEVETDFKISQTWETPADPFGWTTLQAIDCNSSKLVEPHIQNVISIFEGEGFICVEISITGAKKAYNCTGNNGVRIIAIKSQYYAYVGMSIVEPPSWSDLVTLMEAQLANFPVEEEKETGFEFILIIGAISFLVLFVKKKRI